LGGNIKLNFLYPPMSVFVKPPVSAIMVSWCAVYGC